MKAEEIAAIANLMACLPDETNLIEALAATIADELIARFDASRVRVRVRKPEVELGVPVEFTAATVDRSRR